MTRCRIWLLTLAAVLLVAGPALAYTWPALLAWPTVFGQETSGPVAGTAAVRVAQSVQEPNNIVFPVYDAPAQEVVAPRRMPYADQTQSRCPSVCQTPCCDLVG